MDIRTAIRDSVVAHHPVDDRERQSIESFVALFDALADPCSEHADPVHVTGSAIVVGARGVVLHLHKRMNMWLQPGGHIEPGETPWDAARREATEETGLAVRFVDGDHRLPQLAHVDVHAGPRGHTHLDLRYYLLAGDADPAPPEGESPDARWFGWDEAQSMAEPGLAGALAQARRRFESLGSGA